MSILPKHSPLYETFENSIKFGNNIYLFIKASSSKVPSQVPDNYELSLNHLHQLRKRVAHYSFS